MTIHSIHQNTKNIADAPAATSAPAAPSKRESLEARHRRDIVTLLDRHEELRGVHAMADFFDDAVRWTA
jgi:hypothetical protein